MKELKPLPRDSDGKIKREFKANGKTYIKRGFDDAISIRRINEYEKMMSVVGFTASFKEQVMRLNEAIDLANGCALGKETFIDLAMKLGAMREGIMETSKKRYSMAMYLCCLFIVRKDEDLTEWSNDLAESKIEDWNKEGFDGRDFLALALHSIPQFKNVIAGFEVSPIG